MSEEQHMLFAPFARGKLALPNRLVMAPMTRCRASQPGDVPTPLMATYYAQRASVPGARSSPVAAWTRTRAERYLRDGLADLIAFGKPFISNPDLPRRLMTDAPLNALDESAIYGGGEKGYTDYPALD